MKLSVGKKIGIGFGVILGIMVILGIICFISLQDAKIKIVEIREASQRSALATKSSLEQRNSIAAIRGLFAYGDDSFAVQAEKAYNDMVEAQNQLLELTPADKKTDVEKLLSASIQQRDVAISISLPKARAIVKEKAAGNLVIAQALQEQLNKENVAQVKIATEIAKTAAEIKEYNDQQMIKSTEEATGATNRVIMTVMIFSVIAVSIGIVLSILITRRIRGPLTIMLAETKEFAAGDWRQPINVQTNDEIGELADALNTMRNNTRQLIRQINTSVEQVAASSEELTASAEQSAQAANQVAGSITQVATGAAEQLQSIVVTTRIVEQMAAGIQEIASNATGVAAIADETSRATLDGGGSIEKATAQMANIKTSVGGSALVVTKLGERSKEIGQIVDTISGISGQTNLLALNAAIEAARAGEQGRGFAVVAEEVRKLAEQSQEATKQIAILIGEIQTDTNKAVVAMSDGTREVELGIEVVNSAGQTFNKIEGLIAKVSDQIQGISAAIQQMSANSHQIVSSVKTIDKVSKNTASESQTVSAATEEQSASMEEIASSSHALAKMAEELSLTVAKFKV